MKIAFFTEGPTGVKYPRNFANMRTDIAWMVALNSDHYNVGVPTEYIRDHYDLGIIIVPKKNPEYVLNRLTVYKTACRQVATMQEGPHHFWQDWSVNTQIQYLQFLGSMDRIFCHNRYDKKYYRGLFPNIKVDILPSLMIEDAIPHLINKPRVGTMVGGNWVSWYSGQDSYFIAQDLEEPVFAPSMGRKQEYEDYLEDIIYLEYKVWSEWIEELNKVKYAVHLMRTWAAGTFALNCARLKIPCIGYGTSNTGCDTQFNLFPELSVPLGDLESARRIAKHLKTNELFYSHVAEYAHKMYMEQYTEDKFLKKFNELYL